jgi:hypothetical protein
MFSDVTRGLSLQLKSSTRSSRKFALDNVIYTCARMSRETHRVSRRGASRLSSWSMLAPVHRCATSSRTSGRVGRANGHPDDGDVESVCTRARAGGAMHQVCEEGARSSSSSSSSMGRAETALRHTPARMRTGPAVPAQHRCLQRIGSRHSPAADAAWCVGESRAALAVADDSSALHWRQLTVVAGPTRHMPA